MSLDRILDLRKKPDEEYAKDKRKHMNDEKGKQLSIGEATKCAEMKSEDFPVGKDVKKGRKERRNRRR